jgi:hypothetical protein
VTSAGRRVVCRHLTPGALAGLLAGAAREATRLGYLREFVTAVTVTGEGGAARPLGRLGRSRGRVIEAFAEVSGPAIVRALGVVTEGLGGICVSALES